MNKISIQNIANVYGCSESEVQLDGILNPLLYTVSQPKVLWFLKEPWVKESWDMLGKENAYDIVGNSPTYQPMAYVMYSIFNGFPSYEKMDYISKNPLIFASLRHIAFINAKKYCGGTRSDRNDIYDYYIKGKEVIIEQVREINPDIILGCSPHFGDFLNTLSPETEFKNDRFLSWTKTRSGKLLINTYHPQQTTVPRREYVDGIISIVKEFMQ